jgi:anti-sigma factor RsiW
MRQDNLSSSVDDEDIHAMMDNQLAAGRHGEVLAYLGAHPDAADRAAAFIRQRIELAALREALIDGESELQFTGSEEALCRLVRKQHGMRHGLQVGGVLVLILAAASGWWFGSREAVSEQALVHADQGRIPLAQAMLAGVVAGETDVRDPALSLLQAHLVGRSFKRPNLEPLGLRFAESSILRGGGEPAIRLVYTDASGSRYDLVVAVKQSGVELVPTMIPDHYISLTWQHDPLIFSLAAPQGSTQLGEIMRSVSDFLDVPPGPVAGDAGSGAATVAGQPGATGKVPGAPLGSVLETVPPQVDQARAL